MNTPNMHELDMDLVQMTMDMMKYAVERVSEKNPVIGYPKSEETLRKEIGETITSQGIGGENAFRIFKEKMLPTMVSANNPRHLAYIPAAPTRASILFDVVVSAISVHGAFWINSSGGVYGENEAMKWLVSLTGLPQSAFGTFTGGGTTANLSAMVTARETWRNKKEENKAYRGLILTARGAHASITSMARVIDADIQYIEDNDEDKLDGKSLQEKIDSLSQTDRKRLFAVIATAGTTNAGIIDELDEIATVCKKEALWFHVDAAYGGGALAIPEVRPLFTGIEKADSITIDPHKWLFTSYDCGAIIYKNPELAKKVHAQHGGYLELVYKDQTGFNPSEYQISLSRRLRGLPFWFSLAMYGTDKYVAGIRRGLELTAIAKKHIEEMDHVELVREPSLSCIIFKRKGWKEEDYIQWTLKNQKDGYAVVAPTKWTKNGKAETVTRFCFISPETTEEDIVGILNTMK